MALGSIKISAKLNLDNLIIAQLDYINCVWAVLVVKQKLMSLPVIVAFWTMILLFVI